jgi:hypothetical protein
VGEDVVASHLPQVVVAVRTLQQGRTDLVEREPDRALRARETAGPRGRFISSIGHSITRPVIRWISTLCRSSRNREYVVSTWERPGKVPLGEARSTFPKYASASGGSSSHCGRPNQARICSKCPTVPADRAVRQPCRDPRQHEPRQSVSNCSSSSAVAGGRTLENSRMAH